MSMGNYPHRAVGDRNIGVLEDGSFLPFQVRQGYAVVANGDRFVADGVAPAALGAQQEIERTFCPFGVAPRLELIKTGLELGGCRLLLTLAGLDFSAILN